MFPPPPFPLKREPTASAPRGDTLSTRIDCYRSLLMPLVRGRKESKLVRSLVLYVKLGVRFSRRRCGSCSVFEVAHTVYKHAMNKCSFECGCPTRVIPRERSDRGNLAVRRTPNKHIPCISTPRSTHALRAYHCTKCNITAAGDIIVQRTISPP